MRVGILTLPLHVNYGGILQAYALQTVLERMGHHVEVIEIDNPTPHRSLKSRIKAKIKFPAIIAKRIIKRYVLHESIYVFFEERRNSLIRENRQYTDSFISKNIHLHRFNNVGEIDENTYQAYVIGSDQVWRPMYSPNIYHAFLDFTQGWKVRRIAYAPSFGADNWEYTKAQTKVCSSLIQSFEKVSCREDSGVELIKTYLGVENVQWLLDPTLLLSAEDYNKLIKDLPRRNTRQLFNYILDETAESKQLIDEISKDKGLTPFKINVWEPYAKVEINKIVPPKNRIQRPVEEWLEAIRDSEMIVTDSFHACVFSIIYNKPFVAILNPTRGNGRIKSLLKRFHLEDRLISSFDQYKKVRSIRGDYSDLTKTSLDYLKQL